MSSPNFPPQHTPNPIEMNYDQNGVYQGAESAPVVRHLNDIDPYGNTFNRLPEVDGPARESFLPSAGIAVGRTMEELRRDDAAAARRANFNPLGSELPMHGLNSISPLWQDVRTGYHPNRAEQATPARRVAAGLKLGALILATPILGPLAFGVSVPARRIHEWRRGLVHEPRGIVPQPGEPPRRKR